MRSSQLELRFKALDQLAALTERHTNAPSPRVAATLAEQLSGPSPELRQRAAELLGKGQHEPTALAAFLEQLEVVNERLDQLDKAKRKPGKKLPKAEKVDSAEYLARVLGAIGARGAKTRQYTQLFELDEAIVAGLGGLRDDRATEALIATGKLGFSASSPSLAIDRALLEHGTSSAARAVALRLKKRERSLSDLRGTLGKEQRTRLPKKPKSWTGTVESWKARAELQKSQRVQELQTHYDLRLQQALELHQELVAFARARGLEGMPEWSERFATPWNRWIFKNTGSLPEELGRLPGS